MITHAAVLATIVSLLFLVTSPLNGVLVTVMLRPLVDASWRSTLFGFNCLMLLGAAVPLLVLPRILRTGPRHFFRMPLSRVGIAYLLTILPGVALLAIETDVVLTANYFFRLVNGFLGFFMFQFFFHDRERFRKLLFCLLLAGLFPVSVGIYQSITGKVWELRITSGGLVRNVGFYHDAFSIRAYCFQTLAAILLSWSYFSSRRSSRIVLALYGILCCFVAFRVYSKASIILLVVWIILWSVMSRRILWVLVVPLAVVMVNYSAKGTLFTETRAVFSKEILAYEGDLPSEHVLAGRPFIWKHSWRQWKEGSLVTKLFGGRTAGAPHNDFLRILIVHGVFGLTVYVSLLAIIGWKLCQKVLSQRTPLAVIGVMIFAGWLVDSMGLVPTMYPAYQWYALGFFGLTLRGVTGLERKPLRRERVRNASRPRWPTYYRPGTVPKPFVP